MNQQYQAAWRQADQGARSGTTNIVRAQIIENLGEHNQVEYFLRPLCRNLHPFESDPVQAFAVSTGLFQRPLYDIDGK
jgi:hypothetical protein